MNYKVRGYRVKLITKVESRMKLIRVVPIEKKMKKRKVLA